MKIVRYILLSGFAILTACSTSSAPPAESSTAGAAAAASDEIASPLDAATRSGLLAFRDSVWHAWFAGDTSFLRQALPADFLSIGFGEDTVWPGRDQTIEGSASYAASDGKLVRLEFPRTEVQVVGNAAIILTSYRMELENGGKRTTAAGRATEIFVRKDGRWSHPSWHLDSGQ